jgi:hypothetical protein
MDIEVGIRAAHAVEFFEGAAAKARAAVEAGNVTFSVELYGQDNKLTDPDDITISFSNDDMERDVVAADQVYVSLED